MPKIQPTVFVVTDVETCQPRKEDESGKGLVFDMAWKTIDRNGKVYGQASYIAKDVLSKYRPFYYEKVGQYFAKSYDREVKPVDFAVIKERYNRHLYHLKWKGHRVIMSAYNARFDCEALGYTSQLLGLGKFLTVKGIEILCIWEYWAQSCPLNYHARRTASGKFLSTTAESVYAFETQNPNFIEEHIGYHDVDAESEILLKVLRRKKRLPVVKHPNRLTPQVWKLANERLGIC